MEFCDECGNLLPAREPEGTCPDCGTRFEHDIETQSRNRPEVDGSSSNPGAKTTRSKLEELPTTKSGNVRKADAMEWLEALDRPSSAELRQAVVEKPSDFTGSSFPTDISTIRLTGDAHFIETIAGLFTWIVDMEDYSRRVEINLNETEDRDTGESTGNYALYLNVTERS